MFFLHFLIEIFKTYCQPIFPHFILKMYLKNDLKIGLTLIEINVICEVPFYKKKLGITTLTSWLIYDNEIKKW